MPETVPSAADRVDVRKARVSQALWPAPLRRALPLNHAPLKHGWSSILTRCRVRLAGMMHKSHMSAVGRSYLPVTPMPIEPPLVRVLETIDLSRTDIEHFFGEPGEERHTAELSLEWARELPKPL